MWEEPLYKLRRGGRTVIVDVTLSAPRQEEHVTVLPDVIAYLKEQGEAVQSILDFGAGKLRNSVYLARKGFEVCAVEYEAPFKNEDGRHKQRLERAKRYPNFKELIFPHQFLASKRQFDLAILCNVITIVPVHKHRILILKYCYERLRPSGLLLYVSQYGDTHYKERLVHRIADGYLLDPGQSRSTFCRMFKSVEVDELMKRRGFELVRPFSFHKNHARLYRRP